MARVRGRAFPGRPGQGGDSHAHPRLRSGRPRATRNRGPGGLSNLVVGSYEHTHPDSGLLPEVLATASSLSVGGAVPAPQRGPPPKSRHDPAVGAQGSGSDPWTRHGRDPPPGLNRIPQIAPRRRCRRPRNPRSGEWRGVRTGVTSSSRTGGRNRPDSSRTCVRPRSDICNSHIHSSSSLLVDKSSKFPRSWGLRLWRRRWPVGFHPQYPPGYPHLLSLERPTCVGLPMSDPTGLDPADPFPAAAGTPPDACRTTSEVHGHAVHLDTSVDGAYTRLRCESKRGAFFSSRLRERGLRWSGSTEEPVP